MEISDDGCGFDPANAPGPREGHFGLESTRLRMKWLGGAVTVQSKPGEGTVVGCVIPAGLAMAKEGTSRNTNETNSP